MTRLGVILLPAGLLLVLALATSCPPAPVSQDSVMPKAAAEARLSEADLSARPAHYGNSPEAWLTDRGGNSDGGFCSARLQLPLATEPAWKFDYSAAEFSAHPARSLVHYAGTMYLAADSPQLVALKAATGEVVINQDVYSHDNSDTLEQIQRIYAHPHGLLIGQDHLGRYYAWDLVAPGLPRLWLGPPMSIDSGFVTDRNLLLTSWGDQLYGLDALTGEQRWSFPTGSQPGGVVLARDGMMVWWNAEGRLLALDSQDGSLKWSITTTDLIDRAVIDETRAEVLVAYGTEYLECRNLMDGVVLWQYSWQSLFPPEERARRFEAVSQRIGRNANGMNWHGTNNRVDDIALTQTGVVFATASGHVFRLSHIGTELWRYTGQGTVIRLLAFDNAVLICALYVSPEALAWERAVFCLDEPDWPMLTQIRAEQHAANEQAGQQPPPDQSGAEIQLTTPEASPPRKEIFTRFAALSLENGHELSVVEPDLQPASALIPAGGNLVYAEAPWYWAYSGRTENDNRLRVIAYPWIEREGT